MIINFLIIIQEFIMKNYIVESYEKDQEEKRLTTNNARKIEFVNTVKILDELIKEKSTILDCAAETPDKEN